MNKATLLTLPSLLATLLTPVLSCGEDFILYAPKPAEGEQAPASPDKGILVRSVTVKRGDTLSELSRKFIGRASWYPQVLLLNSIENPDLIFTGDKLLVPVPSALAAAAEKKGAPLKKHAKGGKRHGARGKAAGRHAGAAKPEAEQPLQAVRPQPVKREVVRSQPAKHEAVRPEPATNEPVKRETAKPELPQTTRPEKPQQRLTASDERGSFQQAKLAYLKGDYQAALELFSDFRSKYPSSVFSADVALYQADCLLHLSGE